MAIFNWSAKVHTWMVEMGVVASVLVAVALATGGGWIELLGAVAVVLTFGHAQVADRLADQHRYVKTEGVSAPCFRWATRYLVGKEVLWLVYFVAHRSWSALAGVGLFLAYPMWRRWWRFAETLQSK